MNPRHMFCIALLVATLPAQAQVSNTALSVNDQDISRAFLQAQVDAVINGSGMNYGGITQPDAYKQIQDEVVEQLIAQTLLWQEAERRDFIADDAAVDAALEEIRRGALRLAGGDIGKTFTRTAVEAVFEASGGLPRAINVICEGALVGGGASVFRPRSRRSSAARSMVSAFSPPGTDGNANVPRSNRL